MEEKEKRFNLINTLFAIVVIAMWVYSYISLDNGTFTNSKMLALAAATLSWFVYHLCFLKNPYLQRIEKLEEDKLELQAKVEQMKIDLKKKTTKIKKNDR